MSIDTGYRIIHDEPENPSGHIYLLSDGLEEKSTPILMPNLSGPKLNLEVVPALDEPPASVSVRFKSGACVSEKVVVRMTVLVGTTGVKWTCQSVPLYLYRDRSLDQGWVIG